MKDPTKRFSDRVENYVKNRPSYPREIIRLLEEACALTTEALIADIGSGTGKLSELFLEYGCRVIGVEPNDEMRKGGEQQLAEYANFTSHAGKAEATGLPDASVDFVTAGQAFHWFDTAKTLLEFARILKPGGWAVLVWNSRRRSSSLVMQAYEHLIKTYGTDFKRVSHTRFTDEVVARFYAPGGFRLKTFEYVQVLDLEGLKGRLLSSSYAPWEGHPNHVPMLERLNEIFEKYQVNGRVTMEYDTEVYYGQLGGKDGG
jgi:SAM-dependent methyltransferase